MGYKMLRLLKHKTNTNTYKKLASVRLISQTCLYHAYAHKTNGTVM